jgi:hypothetical protein
MGDLKAWIDGIYLGVDGWEVSRSGWMGDL